MSLKIIETLIVTLLAGIMIYYYYQLYQAQKGAKLFLILEVGLRAISFVFIIIEQGFRSYWELLHFVPIFLSITLYLSKMKILFMILSSLIIILWINHLIALY
ncbi:MAG: hypothetical protein ACRCWI_08220 [Brevinema sp.]